MTARGAVACGHPETANAAAEILAEGGNAFDAVIAAFCAATVAEPVLCSLGGGGFLLAHKANGESLLYDFFVDTPRQRKRTSEIDFYPILADFGTATQEFHIGLGSMATPGAIKGLFKIYEDLASLPMTRLVEPAVCMGREGFPLRDMDAFIFQIVSPILTATPESRALFCNDDGALLKAGDRLRQPALANTLESLALEGEALFYQGEFGRRLASFSQANGGQLTMDDLASYTAERKKPFERTYRESRILTNPPPSAGGILIAFALELLATQELPPDGFGSKQHLTLLAKAMALTDQARIDQHLDDLIGGPIAEEAMNLLFQPDLLKTYSTQISGMPRSQRGTTHISIIDDAGNMAALSLSNGEGCGAILPETGIMLNNMLGEEDLSPQGFHNWREGTRISSMMSPTFAFRSDGSVAALGSGGSNRIRTAIMQVLVNLIDFQQPVGAAIDAPRVHVEKGTANIEEGFGKLDDEMTAQLAKDIRLWPSHNPFFGGVHAVTRTAKGEFDAAGDPRRGGAVRII